ncbi:type II secretion system GspH family protein [Patescibacteria group bacterium]|nr:type II secretion system GspH family protein [Patescibacteria group bacterium]MCL5091862.1 type II secretion system GspH family protein [Patescibacteria group bacterium]
MQKTRGFTLLEILVVIGIIAVLIGMGVASFSTAQKKARDAKRKADLQAVQKFMEQCYSINSYQYPDLTSMVGNGTPSLTITCPADSTTIAVADPTLTKVYTVTISVSGADYSVSLPLELGSSYTVTQQQ